MFTERNLAVVERLIELAESRNHTVLDLAIDSVLEITAAVVRDERVFRMAWAN